MKPKPGFWRWRNIIWLTLGVSLLTLVAWSAWAVHWAFNAQPGSSVDYAAKAEALVASYQTDVAHEPNGWEELQAACDLWQATEAAYQKPFRAQEPPPADWPTSYAWPPSISDALAADAPDFVLEHCRAMIAAAEQAGAFSRLGALRDRSHIAKPIPPGKLIETLLSIRMNARGLGRACAARQRFAHQAGDEAAMLASFRDSLTLARAFGRQAGMIDQMTGIALQGLALSELRFELLERPPSESTLRALLHAIDRLDLEPGIELLFEGERLLALDSIQWTHSDDGNGNGRLIPSIAAPFFVMMEDVYMPESRLGNLAGFVYPSKRKTTLVINDLFDHAIGRSRFPPSNREGPTNTDRANALPRNQVFGRLFSLLFDNSQGTHDHADLERAFIRTMLAIEIHRARTGSPPATLADLVPGILPALPVDPWNSDGFVYRLDASKPWGYILYSKGADSVDDQAPYNPETNIHAIRSTGAGTDFHFVYPRYRFGD